MSESIDTEKANEKMAIEKAAGQKYVSIDNMLSLFNQRQFYCNKIVEMGIDNPDSEYLIEAVRQMNLNLKLLLNIW